jgi:uncharacterized phiE125 gp8 family phage protein
MKIEFLRDWRWFNRGEIVEMAGGRADLLNRLGITKEISASPGRQTAAPAAKKKAKARKKNKKAETRMRYRTLRVLVKPSVEPVTLTEAKTHLRIEHSADDSLVVASITAAREWVEVYLEMSLIATKWQMTLDTFPLEIEIPKAPMYAGISPTISYKQSNGQSVTLSSSDFRIDSYANPPVLRTNYGQSWPAHLADYNAVVVTFYAGFGTSGSDVPQRIRNAILMVTTHLYEQRSAVLVGQGVVSKHIELGVQALLDSARLGGYA